VSKPDYSRIKWCGKVLSEMSREEAIDALYAVYLQRKESADSLFNEMADRFGGIMGGTQ
jgi:hypothetical protein